MAETRKTSIRSYFVLGFVFIAGVFGGLVAWSVLAPYEGAVMTSGLVAVETNQQAVQHLEGGIVRHIHVREGDRVGAGEVLLELDGTAARASLASVEARLFELLGQEARLKAERDGNSELVIRAGYGDVLEDPAMQDILVSQNALLDARAASRRSRVNILRQRIRQLGKRIDGLNSEVDAKASQSILIEQEVRGLDDLFEKGLATQDRRLGLKREQSRLTGERESLLSEIAATEVRIGEAEIEITSLTDGFLEEVLTELREVQTQIAELSERRIALKDQLSRLDIIAPREGAVIGIKAHTVGGVINPSEPVMFIVPEDDNLIAKVRIAPQDIDKVAPGQDARLRFSAFNQTTTPEAQGHVIKVSADAIRDEATGAFFYEGTISIPADWINSERWPIQPGMPVEVLVQTDTRSVISYLIKPLQDAMTRTWRE